jgi:iron(III) transport system permease protein
MRRRPVSLMFTVLLLGLLGLALVTPIVSVVRAGFQEDDGSLTLEWLKWVLEDEQYLEGLVNSVWLATFTTLLCLLISVPLALLAESYSFVGKRWWLALIQVPMILPPFVGAIGIKGLLSRNGGINLLLVHLGLIEPGGYIDWLAYPFWSCVVLETLYLYPITFLNVQAALANIDPALDEAARNLGAGPWRRFWRVTLPLMRPGVFAGSTIVFIWAFTELGTPLMVGLRRVTAVQVFTQLETTNPMGDAYALVVVMLVISVALYLLGKLVLGRPLAGMMAKATVAGEPKRLGWKGGLLATLPFALVFLVAVLPHVSVILGSLTSTGIIELAPDKLTGRFHGILLRDVVAFGEPGRGLAALSVLNSLKYSLIATVVDLGLGFGIAYLAVRRRSWLTGLLDSLAMLPLAVPGLVMAFGYFVMTQGDSPLAFLNPLKADPTPLLVAAYSVRRLPFLVRSCAAGLEQTSEALEEASINLGAGPLRTMVTVTIPLLTANFIAGGLLVFSRSMLEVSDSLILAFDKDTYPMTKAIYDLADNPESGLQMASALGVWGMLVLVVTIIGASLALGKRLGALFRV